MTQKPQIWISDFQGIRQRQKSDKIPNNYSPLLKNVSLDILGSWTKRLGTTRLATAGSTGTCKTLISYNQTDILRRYKATTGFFQYYDESSNVWVNYGSATLGLSDISSVNYKERVYHSASNLALCYETGGSFTTVGTPSNTIKARFITEAQSTLFAANVTEKGGTPVTENNRVYYSIADLTNFTPSDQLYDNGQTMATSTRFFTLPSPIRGAFTYSMTGYSYFFTRNSCYYFDITEANSLYGVKYAFPIGLMNNKTICECNGLLIWMSPDKRLWAWSGSGLPSNISWEIEDDANGESIINAISITSTNIINFCAGAKGNKFEVSVGTITYQGATLTNAVIKGLVSQNRQVILYNVDTKPDRPYIYAKGTYTYSDSLFYSCLTNEDVILTDYGTSDYGTSIDAFARTKFFDFGNPFSTKIFYRLAVKFKPTGTSPNYLVIKYALDQSNTYTTLTDGSSVTQHGIINMADSNYSDKGEMVVPIDMPNEVLGRNISIQVGHSHASNSFEITGIMFEYTESDYDFRFTR